MDTEAHHLTEFEAIAISDAVLSAVADILFNANVLSMDQRTGLLEPPKEIADAVKSIEISLGRLMDFTTR